jgi:hypothetical protein
MIGHTLHSWNCGRAGTAVPGHAVEGGRITIARRDWTHAALKRLAG